MGKNGIIQLLLVIILLVGILPTSSLTAAESSPAVPADNAAGIESMMAGLSDEQVRQMLIEELKTTAMEQEYTQQQTMVGPAGIFQRLLRRLSGEHDDNEEQIKNLWRGIPTVLPDLHKVFLTL